MYEFPQDDATFDMERSFLLGSSILVHPVLAKDAASVDVYLPPASVRHVKVVGKLLSF
jgi:alpha-glucosidase (family GH31 glycosyl hydrolase)